MELSEFRLIRGIFELRFDRAYSLWDRTGVIWSSMTEKFEGLQLETTEPNKQIFRLVEKRITTGVLIDKLYVTAHFPETNLADLSILAHNLTITVSKALALTNFNRVGLRLTYEKLYPSKQAASDAVFSIGYLSPVTAKAFNIEGLPLYPEYAFRGEQAGLGIVGRVKADTHKIETVPPMEIEELVAQTVEKHRVEVDLDYYTTAPVPTPQLNAQDWIGSTLHLMRRDGSVFIRKS